MDELHRLLTGLAAESLLQPLVTLVVGLSATVVAVIAVQMNRWSTRMRATLDLLERLETLEYYQLRYRAFRSVRLEAGGMQRIMRMGPASDHQPSERDLCLDYLNQYEFIALGIEKRILDERFFRNTYGPIAIREWVAARPLIGSLRLQNPLYYRAFTKLVKKWDAGLRWPEP